VVTDPALRAAIVATGLAWRVRDTATQIEMLLVPPGTFQMGCTTGSIDFPCDSGWLFTSNPAHSVTLSNPYYLGRFEVTQAQWVAAMGANPSTFQAANGFPGSDTRPVEGVGWLLVQEFLLGNGLRLPTEAEWEFACRAGTQTPFYNGSIDDGSLGDLAWYSGNSLGQTHPVGLKQPNGFGFFDMLGNAFEWVNDWFGFYTADPQQDPTGPVVWDSHVLRGGTALGSIMWTNCHGRTNAAPLNPPCCPDGGQGGGFGFRVARNP
jgi:formylglycine-generating enzyme required for sulfatase activity